MEMEFKQANVLPKTYSSVQGNQNNNNNFTAKCTPFNTLIIINGISDYISLQ